jgi:hypothetical protein
MSRAVRRTALVLATAAASLAAAGPGHAAASAASAGDTTPAALPSQPAAALPSGTPAAPPSVPAAALPVEAPAGLTLDQMYAPPAEAVPGEAGSVVWWRDVPAGDPTALPQAGVERRVIYRSTAIDGTPNVESATLFVPRGAAPAGGWKVVVWNHVTTGGADLCAPSRATPLLPGTTTKNPEYERLTRGNQVTGDLLNRGLAVVRPDYEGIGTPGPHPYLVGRSLARSAVDSVRAAREMLPGASADFAVSGQSEGGIAALWTSQLVSTYAPELHLAAAVAATPPIDNKTMVFGLGGIWPGGQLSAMSSLMLRGAALSDPVLGASYPAGILTAAGVTRTADVETKCLAQMEAHTSLGGLPFSKLYRPGMLAAHSPMRARLFAALDAEDARAVTPGPEPIRVYAGSLDVIALQSSITKVVRQYRAGGANVSYKTYPFATHVTIANNDQGGLDMANWLKARLG